jgi:hypothetical protein
MIPVKLFDVHNHFSDTWLEVDRESKRSPTLTYPHPLLPLYKVAPSALIN